MTTARDVKLSFDAKLLLCKWFHEDDVPQFLDDLLSAPDSVRLELAAQLLPWRPIETAPKDGDAPLILGIRKGAKIPGIIGWDDGWYWFNGMFKSPCEPTHWLPLPDPPKEVGNRTNPELPEDQRERNVDWVRREIKDVRDALNNLEMEIGP